MRSNWSSNFERFPNLAVGGSIHSLTPVDGPHHYEYGCPPLGFRSWLGPSHQPCLGIDVVPAEPDMANHPLDNFGTVLKFKDYFDNSSIKNDRVLKKGWSDKRGRQMY